MSLKHVKRIKPVKTQKVKTKTDFKKKQHGEETFFSVVAFVLEL